MYAKMVSAAKGIGEIKRSLGLPWRALISTCLLLLLASLGPVAALADTALEPSNNVRVSVDNVWVGTGVPYEGISVGPIVYLAYYNAVRELTVARIDTRTGKVQKKPLNNKFKGWDAHNYITLAYDKDGFLHVSGNMHDAPLIYARTTRPDDFDSLTLVNKMIGKDETSVTYPRFFKFPDGSLGFSFRSGHSGDGDEFINKFENGQWIRLLSKPLFAPDSVGAPANAYHTDYTSGPDGYFHVAWVWRHKSGADFNFNVNYARSRDLKNWEDSQGRKLALPITPSSSEIVDAIPIKGGLLNNIRLAFDANGAPVISYLKYDKDGNSQLYHARHEDKGWKIVQATNWKYRWAFDYGGTLVKKISFSGVRVERGKLLEDVIHVTDGSHIFVYDPVTLKRIDVLPPAKSAIPLIGEEPLPPFKRMAIKIRPVSQDSFKGYIKWNSLGVDNNDRPRNCESIRQLEGCSMTSALYLVGSAKE